MRGGRRNNLLSDGFQVDMSAREGKGYNKFPVGEFKVSAALGQACIRANRGIFS